MSSMKTRARCIKALEDKFGRITAEKLVEAARDRRHPMHEDFPWDDKQAAHERRVDIARRILNSTRVEVTHSTKTISTVGYIRDPDADPGVQGYVNVTVLRTDREASEEALMAEVTRITSMYERARELAAALDLEDELETALQAALRLRARLRRGPAIGEEDRPAA